MRFGATLAPLKDFYKVTGWPESRQRASSSVSGCACHRARYPERRIDMPLLEGLSLALDIDTEEEAAALA